MPALPEADGTLARILCFTIDPARRGEGLSGQLLDLFINDSSVRGFETVEAAPNDSAYSTRRFRGVEPGVFLSRLSKGN